MQWFIIRVSTSYAIRDIYRLSIYRVLTDSKHPRSERCRLARNARFSVWGVITRCHHQRHQHQHSAVAAHC